MDTESADKPFKCCECSMPAQRNPKPTFHAMQIDDRDLDKVQRSSTTGHSTRRILLENSLTSFSKKYEYLTAANKVSTVVQCIDLCKHMYHDEGRAMLCNVHVTNFPEIT